MIGWKIAVALFFIKPWLDRKIEGEKTEKRELGREREKKTRRNPTIVLGKVFLTRNQQETREGTRELRRQREDIWMTKIPTTITPPLDQNNI